MEIKKSNIVIRSQFISALKQITRFRSHMVFSLVGLALGLACVLAPMFVHTSTDIMRMMGHAGHQPCSVW